MEEVQSAKVDLDTKGVGYALERSMERVARLLAAHDGSRAVGDIEPSFDSFDEAARRTHRRGPDAATIARIRGDKNRAFLMD